MAQGSAPQSCSSSRTRRDFPVPLLKDADTLRMQQVFVWIVALTSGCCVLNRIVGSIYSAEHICKGSARDIFWTLGLTMEVLDVERAFIRTF